MKMEKGGRKEKSRRKEGKNERMKMIGEEGKKQGMVVKRVNKQGAKKKSGKIHQLK